MPDAFGTIPVPGTTVKALVKPGDILASYSPPPLIKGGVIASGQTSTGATTGIVSAGQVLDYNTGTKKYIITAAGTAAVGILLQDVDTSGGDALGNVILSGTVKKMKIIGFGGTPGTITGLSARTIVRSVGNADDYVKF